MSTAPKFAEIDVDGPDARSFLHSQLSSDVQALDVGAGQFACYLNVDGRVQSLGFLRRTAEASFRWLMPADNAEAVAKRLTMYKLRAKCSVTYASADVARVGADSDSHGANVVAVEDGPGAAYASGQVGTVSIAGIPTHIAAGSGMTGSHWWNACIEAGIPWLTGAAQNEHLPQALGLQRLSAFSLKKGCYPGQEIVARTHYLGRVKRRLAWIDAGALPAGTALSHADTDIGTIVASGDARSLAVLREGEYITLDAAGRAAGFSSWCDSDLP